MTKNIMKNKDYSSYCFTRKQTLLMKQITAELFHSAQLENWLEAKSFNLLAIV